MDIWNNGITMQPLCYAGLRKHSWPQCPNPPICSCPPWQLGDGDDHVHDQDDDDRVYDDDHDNGSPAHDHDNDDHHSLLKFYSTLSTYTSKLMI